MPTNNLNLGKLVSDSGLSEGELLETLPLLKVSGEVLGNDLEIEVTPDRPDLLGQKGLARALRAYFAGKDEELKTVIDAVPVFQDEGTLRQRGYFQGFFVNDVKLDDDDIKELMMFQELLHKSFCRNRTKASIGLHDAAGISEIRYTTARGDSIRFVPLGESRQMTPKEVLNSTEKGKTYSSLIKDDEFLFLISNKGVMSMPPVINSVETQVSQSTKRLFVDVEGTDPRTVELVTGILVRELSGYGNISRVVINGPGGQVVVPSLSEKKHELSILSVSKRLGISLTPVRAAQALRKMGHRVQLIGEKLEIFSPYYRFDVISEVDLIEDVMMGLGLKELTPSIPNTYTIGKRSATTSLEDKIREVLANLGYVEISMTLLSEGKNQSLVYAADPVKVKNPVSSSYDSLREGLLPDLLQALFVNKKKRMPLKLFEVGPVVIKEENFLTQKVNAAAVISDYSVSAEDIQGDLLRLAKRLRLALDIKSKDFPFAITGRSAVFDCGWIAEISPEVLLKFDYDFPVVAFELTVATQFRTEITQ
ncbi:MAG: phenylalanine--tRNA ligase subunit beta [Thermoprotei archaeon]|nr:phenylalanine--tRNA ligase subunit beta [TACK group archaeon]